MGDHKQTSKKWQDGNVYVIDYGDGKTFKIGCTAGTPEARLKQISTNNVIMPLRLVMNLETWTNHRQIENIVHMMMDENHVSGEWFKLDFVELVELYQFLEHLGCVNLYDRWYELVPKDVDKYIEHGAFIQSFPPFAEPEAVTEDQLNNMFRSASNA